MTQNERDLVMQEFRTGAIRILVTSSSHSRGIDVHHVGLIINYDLPGSDVTEFVHRAGRTARYGRHGVILSFVADADNSAMKNIERDCSLNIPTIDIDYLRGKSVDALAQ